VRVDVGSFIGMRISGLSQNPNAFAFMLLLMLSAAIALQARSAVRIAAMTIALVGLWFAASRAGFLAVPIVLGAALFMGAAFRPLLMSVICAAAVIAGIAGVGALIELVPCVGWGCQAHSVAGAGNMMLLLQQTETASTQQHLATVQEGLAIFLAHPIFGAGLGAYVDGYVRATGTPLVIHSTPVWLLAETGIVGFAVFAAGACRLLACAVRYRGDPASSLLLLILCTMAVMSSVHEMMYQRGFWLLLGAALAMPVTVSIRARRRDHGHLPAHATV
jgi:O-antigen ligase